MRVFKISIVLLVLLVRISAEDVSSEQELVQIKYGENYQFTIKSDQRQITLWTKFDEELIRKYQNENQNLNVLTENRIFSHTVPLIYISDTRSLPQRYTCAYNGLDICFIPEAYLKPDQIIYITIFKYGSIKEDCNFTIQLSYTRMESDKSFVLGDSFLLKMDPQEDRNDSKLIEKLFKLYVPDPSKDLYHITVVATTTKDTQKYFTQNVRLLVNAGQRPPSSGASLWGLYRNQYGMTFTAFQGDQNFITDQYYYFMIVASVNTTIEISTRGNQNKPIPIIFDDKSAHTKTTFYDAMPIGRKITYSLNVSEQLEISETQFKGSLIVQLLTNQGNPDLYINCNQEQTQLDQSKWKSIGYGLETLLISHKELIQTNCQLLFITVYAQVCAGYTLEIQQKTLQSEQVSIPIIVGVTETGYLFVDEMAIYDLYLTDEQADINIVLTANNGNPDLLLKKCPPNQTEEQCLPSIQTIKEQIRSQNQPHFIGYSNNVGNDLIKLAHRRGSEVGERYLIVVYSDGQFNNDNEYAYQLQLQYDQKHLLLRESLPMKGKVMVDQYQYYEFDVGSLKDLKRVVIQVSSVQGDAGLYISRSEAFPTYHNAEKAACFCNSILEYDSSELSETRKLLYIGIFGLTNADYYVNVLVQRRHQDGVVYRLYEGVPQKINIMGEQELVYIDIQFGKLSAADISISQKTSAFSIFEARISSNEDLVRPSFKYLTSSGHFLVFKQDGSNEQEYVRLKIQKLSSGQELQFVITMERGESKLVEIIEGQTKHISLNYRDTVQFQFEVSERDSRYMLLHTSLDLGIRMKVWTDRYELDEDLQHDLSLDQGISLNSILMVDPLEKYCESESTDIKSCYFFGKIELDEDYLDDQDRLENQENIQVNVILLRFGNSDLKSSVINLSDGDSMVVPYFGNGGTESENKPIQYRFFTKVSASRNPLFIDIQGENIDVFLSYSIIDLKVYKGAISKTQYPGLDEFGAHNFMNLTSFRLVNEVIQAEQLAFCGNDCLVAYSVFLKSPLQHQQMSSFVIQAVTDVIDLTPQHIQVVYGNVEYKAYKYYRVSTLKEHTILDFKLQILSDGDARLIAAYNQTTTFRPTFTKQVKCDQCQVSKRQKYDFIDQIQYSPAGKGDYIVGVYGDRGLNITYQLFWSFNEVKSLSAGMPERTFLESKQTYSYVIPKSTDQLLIKIATELTGWKLVLSLCEKPAVLNCVEGLKKKNSTFSVISDQSLTNLVNKPTACDSGCTIIIQAEMEQTPPGEVFGGNTEEFNFVVSNFENNNHFLLLPGLFFEEIITQNQSNTYQIFFSHELSHLDHSYLITMTSLSGFTNLKVFPETLLKHQPFEKQYWIEIDFATLQKQKQLNFHVQVEGCSQDTCYYMIGCVRRGQSFQLHPGMTFADSLDATKTKQSGSIFRFKSNLNSSYVTLNLQKQPDSVAKLKIELVGLRRYDKFFNFLHLEQGNEITSQLLFLESNSPYQLTLDAVEGTFNYTLLLNNGNLLYLPIQTQDTPDLALSYHLYFEKQYKDQSDVFQFYVQKSGTIIFQIRSCTGNFLINAATTLENIYKNIYDLQVYQSTPGNTYITTHFQKPGNYFLKIDLDTAEFKQGGYFIDAQYIESSGENFDDLPQFSILPGNDGLIDQGFDESGNFILRWSELSFLKDKFSRVAGKAVQFSILLTLNDPMYHNDRKICNGNYHKSRSIYDEAKPSNQYAYTNDLVFPNNQSEYQTSLNLKEIYASIKHIYDIQSYYVSISTIIDQSTINNLDPKFHEISIHYKTVMLKFPKFQRQNIISSQSQTLILVVAVLAIFTVTAVIYFYLRRKKLIEKQLHHELSNVRETANQIIESQGILQIDSIQSNAQI